MAEIIKNSATINYHYNDDDDPDSYTSGSETSNELEITLETPAQAICVTKSASPTTFEAGSIIDYTVTIKNTGSSYFVGVRVIDDLGSGSLNYVLGSASLTVGSLTYPVTPSLTNPLTFALQELSLGESMVLKYKCQVDNDLSDEIEEITNNLQAIGYTSTSDVSGYDSCTIYRRESDVSIVKSASATSVVRDQSFEYYITLKNHTDETIDVVDVTDQLPDNFVLTSVKLKIGSDAQTTLSSSDYTLSSSNYLTIPSSTGPSITIPANGTTIITLTGYIN
jgi:uncharacterized repeat protein (TIGR01451 family)